MSQRKEKYVRSLDKRLTVLEQRQAKVEDAVIKHGFRLMNVEDDVKAWEPVHRANETVEERKRKRELRRKRENAIRARNRRAAALTAGILLVSLLLAWVLTACSQQAETVEVVAVETYDMSYVVPTETLPLAELICLSAEPAEEVEETPEEAIYIAKMLVGEASGCSTTEQAAAIWCAINRVESDDPFYPDEIIGVITQEGQFHGYDEDNAVLSHFVELAVDVLERWELEQSGVVSVGRVLPSDYLWFHGDGTHNYFRNEYIGGDEWDWSLESPYDD